MVCLLIRILPLEVLAQVLCLKATLPHASWRIKDCRGPAPRAVESHRNAQKRRMIPARKADQWLLSCSPLDPLDAHFKKECC